MAAMPGPVHALLKVKTLAELLQAKAKAGGHKATRVVVLEHDATVGDALLTLQRSDVLSAPVFVFPTLREGEGLADEEDAAERPAYLGFVDVLDILHGLLATLPPGMGHQPDHWRRLLVQAVPAYLTRRLVMLPSHNDGALVFSAHSGMSVLDLIKDGFLGGGDGTSPSKVTHRVAVFDSTGQVTHIVSQSDVIAFVAGTPHALDAFGDATLEQLRIGHARGGVAQVARTLPTVEALLFMASQGVSSVAVIDDDASGGALCGNLSGSDLRGLAGGDMHELAQPVGAFLAGSLPLRGQAPRELVTAAPESTLRTVVHRMAACRVHRVYIVDPQTRRPVGIVTCTDVLRAIVALETAA